MLVLLFQSDLIYASLFYGNKVGKQPQQEYLILGDVRRWSFILTMFQRFVIAQHIPGLKNLPAYLTFQLLWIWCIHSCSAMDICINNRVTVPDKVFNQNLREG